MKGEGRGEEWREGEREREEYECLLIHSPNTLKSWEPIQVSHVSGRNPITRDNTCCLPESSVSGKANQQWDPEIKHRHSAMRGRHFNF